MIAALEGGEWSAARPGRTLLPVKSRYPFYRRLGGPQGRSGRAEDLVPAGIRSRTVHHYSGIYTKPHSEWSNGIRNRAEFKVFIDVSQGKYLFPVLRAGNGLYSLKTITLTYKTIR